MALTNIISSISEESRGNVLDGFLCSSPFAAYQQSRAWANVAPRGRRHDFLTYLCLDGIVPIGAAIVRRTYLSPLHWLATIQRGPVVHAADALEIVLPEMLASLAARGCCSVQLAPRVRGRDLPRMAEALRASGFAPLDDDRQPLHRATGIVWLDKSEEAVFAGFRQRGRRQVRAAEKAGITVRVAEGQDDVARYQVVLDSFRASRPDYDMAGLPDAAGQAALIDALGGAMLLAECGGETIGGHAFVRQGDEAIWLSLATSDAYPDIPRSYPLVWQAMRMARGMGCVGYDLAGIPIEEPRDAGEANRHQFKAAFAPTRRIMPPMQIAALKPMPHFVLFGARELYLGLKRRRRAAA